MERISRNNIGAVLAFIAGVCSLGLVAWPSEAPQGQSVNPWFFIALGAGSGFLAAPFLADRHRATSKTLLAIGGLVLVGSGLFFGYTQGGGIRSVWAASADLVPAALALIAALLIGPMERRAVP